jgi:hypothetical protein
MRTPAQIGSAVALHLGILVGSAAAAPLSLDLSDPKPFANAQPFTLGTAVNPAGISLTADGISLRQDGKPFIPVMGEFHFSRYPRAEWRDELLKMKAGGIMVVASYVFWIHHEEIEGKFDWSGDRDLHAFVQLCGQLGLRCIVRCGPWDHGEVRNGGFPEWLLEKHLKLRSDDPAYLKEVAKLYSAIAGQLKGTLWKDGGPVIGIQIENEYSGHAEHLLTLRQMAIDAGLDVPIYTRTGWPEMHGVIAFGKLLPLYGAYAEGFWDRKLTTMPGHYWKEFVFKSVRTDTAIASEHFGDHTAHDAADIDRYPYLTCELGAGMMCSYHRRINVFAMDPLSILMVKLGSGSNLPGYYMYHGGTNPQGIDPQLQENQASKETNYNDMPVKTYDFQTALGEFGQIRPQYHLLRPVHLFLADFGARLATMATVIPDLNVKKDDVSNIRYGVRTDGRSGFVFINNYQRLLPMPAKADAQFSFKLKTGDLTFPSQPTSIAGDHAFFWPFNFDLGDGINLAYATAQPVCDVTDGGTQYTIFASTGNPAEFAFDTAGLTVDAPGGWTVARNRTVLRDARPGLSPIATMTTADGRRHSIILLSQADALRVWKGRVGGRDRVVLSSDGVVFDGDDLRLTSTDSVDPTVSLLPAPKALTSTAGMVTAENDGVFGKFTVATAKLPPIVATVQQIKPAGKLRHISLGAAKVAQAPTTADFDQAGQWLITVPPNTDPPRKLLLRVRYTGDVARAYSGDTLLTDNFYNGTPFDIGVNRYGAGVLKDGLTLKILPLQKDAPIYMLDDKRPDFAGQSSALGVQGVEVIESHEVRLHGGPLDREP